MSFPSLIRTPVPLGLEPHPYTSFNLHHLLKDPVSTYGHIWGLGFNTGIRGAGDTFSPYQHLKTKTWVTDNLSWVYSISEDPNTSGPLPLSHLPFFPSHSQHLVNMSSSEVSTILLKSEVAQRWLLPCGSLRSHSGVREKDLLIWGENTRASKHSGLGNWIFIFLLIHYEKKGELKAKLGHWIFNETWAQTLWGWSG